MKYKALLTGNNKTVINEFFYHMDFSFECLCSSQRYEDILRHVKYVRPDVLVYCLYGEKQEEMKQIVNVEYEVLDRGVQLVIVGDAADCERFGAIAPMTDALIFQRPITPQKLEESLVKFLDGKHKEEKSRAEAEMAAQEPAAGKTPARMAERATAQAAERTPAPEKTAALRSGTGAEKTAERKPIPQEKPAGRRHILVVDDDSNVLKLIKSFLADQYDVATAINGKVAMKFLETRETDLVLLDYEMPGENGPAVLSRIRANKKTENLPVVFLTGVTEREKIKDVLTMKPQGYLLKPIDMHRLNDTIEGILH